jgi:predicted HAD superfamily Cof-like phosphohydrolase
LTDRTRPGNRREPSTPNAKSEQAVHVTITSESASAAPVVCLSGSTRFKRTFLEAQLEESLAGRVVLSLPVFTHVDGCQLSAHELATLSRLRAARIAMSDEILVIDVGGYVGPGTSEDVELAGRLGKHVRYWSRERTAAPERRLRPMDVLLDVAEIHAAQGFTYTAHPTTSIAARMKDLSCALIDEEAGEYRAAVDADDLVEIADALADLLWVVIVGALTFGIPLGEVFAEVLRSNRSKADAFGRVELGPNGKIRKGPHFEPPDLSSILDRHAESPAAELRGIPPD